MTEVNLAGGTDGKPDVTMLMPGDLEFAYSEHRLRLRMCGEETWQEVSLARLFPLSSPEGWIAVVGADDKEIGMLRDLHGLTVGSMAAIREELSRRYLIPRIQQIRVCRDRFDLLEWEVETDRGPITFLMRHAHENIQHRLPNRLVFIDVEGNRYDVDDLSELDEESQRWIEQRL